MNYEMKTKTPNPNFETICDIEPSEVYENASRFTLIDVRENDEFNGELGHIQTSILINLSTIPEKLKSILLDKPVIFVCRSGGRSAQACSYAHQQGLKNSFNMRGGMLLWNRLQFPIVKELKD